MADFGGLADPFTQWDGHIPLLWQDKETMPQQRRGTDYVHWKLMSVTSGVNPGSVLVMMMRYWR
jgi:hypothetical protein